MKLIFKRNKWATVMAMAALLLAGMPATAQASQTPTVVAPQTVSVTTVSDNAQAASEHAAILKEQQAVAKAKIAAAQVAAAKNVDNTLTKLGYGADKGWRTPTAADWNVIRTNAQGGGAFDDSFPTTPEAAARAYTDIDAITGTKEQKANPSNWVLRFNPECMMLNRMAYKAADGSTQIGDGFVECGPVVWVNIASNGVVRLQCGNKLEVAPVPTKAPVTYKKIAPNPKLTPPPTTVVQKYCKANIPVGDARCQPPKPPMVKFCIKNSGDQTLQSIERSKFNPKTMTTDIALCVKKVEEVKACVKGSGDTNLVAVDSFNPATMSTNPKDCAKPILACIIHSGETTLSHEVSANYNRDIFSTDLADCAKLPCGCVPPPVQRCDVTTQKVVTITEEQAKDTNRYKPVNDVACCPPVVTCPEGQTPNPDNPQECLNTKTGDFHGNPGINPVKTDNPKATNPGLPATNTETGGGRGGTVDTSATNTNPKTDPGTKAPGATEPNKTPVTQVNEGGATDANGTNSGTVKSDPIDAPTMSTPASAVVDNQAAQAAADQAAKDAADVAAVQAARAQAQAAADQAAQAVANAQAQAVAAQKAAADQAAAQQAAQTQAAQAAQAAANAAAAQPAPTSAPTAGTTAAGAPVMATVTVAAG